VLDNDIAKSHKSVDGFGGVLGILMDGLIVQTVGDAMYWCLPCSPRLGLHVMMVVCEAVLILLSDMGSRSINFPYPTQTSVRHSIRQRPWCNITVSRRA
jgi:ABC-type enterochelin transport system permease subunit